MDNSESDVDDKTLVHRPRTLCLEHGSMDIDINEQIQVIDLCTPDMDIKDIALSPSRFSDLQQKHSILACYPINSQHEQGPPLLTNIPPHQLTRTELAYRQSNAFPSAFRFVNYDSMIPSFLREKYQMYFVDLLERLKVDVSILDYNYIRLNNYMRLLMYEQIKVFNSRIDQIPRIEESEYPLLLEFFLQFDINLFYMKTCSLHYARPRTLNEGLFCLQEPEARYEFASCGNCALCYPQYDRTYRVNKSIVAFNQAHQHRFINGYRAILNCSAFCYTRNVIYALTCPCGRFDYVGATTQSLHDRLIKHREHGNRIIHEFLLGEANIVRDLTRGKSNEISTKDHMKLYQHSARCHVAMQIFLDANPQYWRFIPMTFEESETLEQRSIHGLGLPEELDWTLRSREDCKLYVASVPKPPPDYRFSNRQQALQLSYFYKKRDKILPNQSIDLYNATIVAVLPESCSEMFRFTIESLFITHADTKLNTIGHMLNENSVGNHHHPLFNPWLDRGTQWCDGLQRRPQPK
ncbi:unnamed protein product [Rotaria socialis]|uniref:Uncharacterized protein n=4 Tax=Rotaria socialis TaxID=392032 RepID=A0A818FKQ8_9BILA|nr:unnamed protein product [Rotaria socialis]